MVVNRSKRGQMRAIEVIIALFIIVAALCFADLLSITVSSRKYESIELEKLGYNVLHDLDKQGLLPRFVYQSEWANLTAALKVSLPLNVYFNMTVYKMEKTTVDGATVCNYIPVNSGISGEICNGDSTAFSDTKDVASVTYGVVGYTNQVNAKYDPKILILEIARG